MRFILYRAGITNENASDGIIRGTDFGIIFRILGAVDYNNPLAHGNYSDILSGRNAKRTQRYGEKCNAEVVGIVDSGSLGLAPVDTMRAIEEQVALKKTGGTIDGMPSFPRSYALFRYPIFPCLADLSVLNLWGKRNQHFHHSRHCKP